MSGNISAALTRAATVAATSLAGALGAVALVKAGDAMTASIMRLNGALEGRGDAQTIYDQLYASARITGAALDETVVAFGNYDLAMAKNNRTTDETVTLVTGLQAAMTQLGVSGAQASSVTLQLGQALGKGFLNGDELVSLREAMPRLVEAMRLALNMTDEEFSKAAENKGLTAKRLIGPLLEFSQKATRTLAEGPLTMARAFAGLRTTTTRFLADLDKELGLSKLLARGFRAVADAIERWRSGLSVVGDFVRSLGGLERILTVVGYAVGFTTALLVAMNAALLVTIARVALMAAPFVAAGLVIAGLALLLDDFVRWVQGNTSGTLFGHWFGDFETLIAPVKAGIADIKAAFTAFFDAVSAGWARMEPQLTEMARITRVVIDAVNDAANAIGSMFDALAGRLKAAYEIIKPMIDAIRGAFSSMQGEGAGSDPAEQQERRQRFGNRGALGNFPSVEDMSARMPEYSTRLHAGQSISAAQNNAITNQVTINAPGADPASIASAAQAGVTRGSEALSVRVGNSFARALGVANPRVEAAAQ